MVGYLVSGAVYHGCSFCPPGDTVNAGENIPGAMRVWQWSHYVDVYRVESLVRSRDCVEWSLGMAVHFVRLVGKGLGGPPMYIQPHVGPGGPFSDVL